MRKPLASVIIRTYNRKKMLIRALDSIKEQTYPKDFLEVIIVDDCSIEDIKGTVLAYNKFFPAQYIRNSVNLGVSGSLNVGFKNSHGEYIFTLDDDDMFHPRMVEACVDAMEKDFAVSILFVDRILLYEKENTEKKEDIGIYSKKTKDEFFDLYVKEKIRLIFTASCIRRQAFPKNIPYFKLGTDWYVGFYALKNGCASGLKEPLYIFGVHENHVWRGNLQAGASPVWKVLNELNNEDIFSEKQKCQLSLVIKLIEISANEFCGKKNIQHILGLWAIAFKLIFIYHDYELVRIKLYEITKRTVPFNVVYWKNKVLRRKI